MKKILPITLSVLFVFIFTLGFLSCNFGKEVCQHRDADDNLLCDKCGESYTDGKDVEDAPVCQHRDADDNLLCDKCGENYTDGKDVGDAPVCEHIDADDNYLCDKCEDVMQVEGLEFKSNGDGTCYVSGIGTFDKPWLIIPSKSPENEIVTAIGDSAFSWCENLTSVTIPDSVTTICDDAFVYCTSLTSMTLGNSVITIGDYAFYACNSLTSITIPDSVTTIGDSAFSDSTSLASVILGNSVTTIGDYAFAYCDITRVTIPDSVTTIGDCAFYGCENLTSIEISENNTAYKSIEGNLYTKDGKILIQYAIGKSDTSFTIPDGVTTIGELAFSSCQKLTILIFSDSVTTIGEYAFAGSTSLASIEVSKSNAVYSSINGNLYTKDGKTLVQYAIGKSDTSFTIPDGVTTIGASAFRGCDILTNIIIGNSVTTIGEYAFDYCYSLTSVTFKDTSTWYITYNYDDVVNMAGGERISVEDRSDNAENLTSMYCDYYWYKK